MSAYDRPHQRGGRRRQKEDLNDRREIYETPEQKLRTTIIRLGEVDPLQELPQIAKQLSEHEPRIVPALSEGFRIGVTEQPYKIPYYAALLRLLHDPTEADLAKEGSSLGKLILEDFWKGFQAFLDKLAWRDVRLCIQFFAHLTVSKLITPESFHSLLQAFTSVLDEFGASHGRAKRAALCAAEGLMIAGVTFNARSIDTTEIINAIQAYVDTTSSSHWLVQPIVQNYTTTAYPENVDELLDTALAALRALNAADFVQSTNSYPQPYTQFDELSAVDFVAFDLPAVLVPPEVIELDGLSTEAGEDAQVKKDEWPEYFLRLFDNSVTPDPKSPQGYAIRSAILDIIDVFEVNRKECARLLLEFPKWTLPGTFKPKPGTQSDAPVVSEKDWQLESTIIEIILGDCFLLPESPHKPVYYIALITEICKLSPTTVGPAVGKSIRKLYSSLADGLDVDIARKFAEWFAVHMSNFGFQWVWKEWIPDVELTLLEPRRAFMRRAVEFEIRLSYHDRISKTLPETMQHVDANLVPEQAPGPNFEYDDAAKPHYEAAQSILNILRNRAKAEDVIGHLDSLRNTLEISDGDVSLDTSIRFIAVQSLLHLGSRSFSHFLNAIERYLPLLRHLASATSGSGTTEAKADILTAAAAFWKRNRQMVAIVFDKLMQYQIVDPTDVVAWTFLHGGDGRLTPVGHESSSRINAFEWDLLRGALNKANGRVVIARRKITALRKEEDDKRARAKAIDGADVGSMEVDAEAKQDDVPADSPALTIALKAFASLTREQKSALSRTLDGFVSCLSPSSTDVKPSPSARQVISDQEWQNRANWDDDQWSAWETWGWYRQFCRLYSPYLRNYATTLGTVSLSKIEGSKDSATDLFMKTWNIATGQE